MSNRIREILRKFRLLELSTHEERLELDRQIEEQTGRNCDEALLKHLISEQDVCSLMLRILKRKKKEELVMVV